jgi:S-adenosylmethionine hydrolase
MKRIITLTTDFGLQDHYIGAMKGVILAINPDVTIVDITHKVPRQDIFKGAFILRNFYRYFFRGTIHIVVVDPGVGGGRKPIALEADDNIFIGPDNGVFTFVYRESRSVRSFEISNPKYILPDLCSTFHGRDIFAPAAAHVSLGISMEDLGKNVKKPVTISIKKPEAQGDVIIGEVIYTDHFGNLITNIPADLIKPRSRIYIGETIINGISKSYADVPKGVLLASFGSSGFLEISVNQGRASEVINSREKGSGRTNRMPEVRIILSPK